MWANHQKWAKNERFLMIGSCFGDSLFHFLLFLLNFRNLRFVQIYGEKS